MEIEALHAEEIKSLERQLAAAQKMLDAKDQVIESLTDPLTICDKEVWDLEQQLLDLSLNPSKKPSTGPSIHFHNLVNRLSTLEQEVGSLKHASISESRS